MRARHTAKTAADAVPAGLIRRLCVVSVGVAALLMLAAAPSLYGDRAHQLSGKLMVIQDLPILLGVTALWVGLLLSPGLRGLLREAMQFLAGLLPPTMAGRWTRPAILVPALALAALIVGVAGARLSFAGYPFSVEEFLANFDAEIFRHGQPMAEVPTAWRPFAPALQPMFMLTTAGNAWWVSSYLPVSALFRALAGSAATASLVNPLWAAVSVIAVWGVANRLWPRRPEIGLAAAVLLATSSQFLVSAMTSYAMPAHLALNLVWLWLFLRGGKLGHAGAIVVGFAACGLHQLAFHPLFAAPFVLQLWLERRWRTAILYTAAYGAICLFWVSYWTIAVRLVGAEATPSTVGGAAAFFARTLGLLAAFDISDFGLMAMNFIRFVTWQNPLLSPLALLGAAAAIRARGPLRSLVLGLVLTTAAMCLILAYQGYGSGYRYLHGLLGSACLIAAWWWARLVEGLREPDRKAAWAGFAAVAAGSVLILLPVRLWQAADWARPYVAASAAIAHDPADVVIFDETGIQFGRELVRNDPFLRRRPIVLDLAFLTQAQVGQLCARHRVAFFDAASAAKLGAPIFQAQQSGPASSCPSLAPPPPMHPSPSGPPRPPSSLPNAGGPR